MPLADLLQRNDMSAQDSTPPRLLPDRKLPPYSYVPGVSPHPVSDPNGHSFQMPLVSAPAGEMAEIDEEKAFRWGCDLFNQGYYWESHEVWEALWHKAGRSGPEADFLKGLIQLAAAGVKAREGQVHGVERHAKRAVELFRQVAAIAPGQLRFGLDLDSLILAAEGIALGAAATIDTTQEPVRRVWPLTLLTEAE